jgi:hypothetical protein
MNKEKQTELEIIEEINNTIRTHYKSDAWYWIDNLIKLKENQKQGCGNERPKRKTLCQLEKGHKGSHQATIYWEDE